MGYIKSDFDQIKNNLSDLIGEEILIVEPISKRGKKLGKLAKIENTYGDYFRVKYENDHVINYSYADIFTKDIKIQTYDGENFNPIEVPRPLTKKETIPPLNITSLDELSDV